MGENHRYKVIVAGSNPAVATTGVVDKSYFVWADGSNPFSAESGIAQWVEQYTNVSYQLFTLLRKHSSMVERLSVKQLMNVRFILFPLCECDNVGELYSRIQLGSQKNF